MKPLLLAALLLSSAAHAAPAPTSSTDDARILLEKSVGFATVKGRGQGLPYAEFLRAQLLAMGFAASDITLTPKADETRLHAVWRGTGKKPPIAIISHMDVVEAKPADWTRDPFTATAADGFLFGRGVADNKFDLSMSLTAIATLRREGFKPNRDIHLFFSGDEETDGLTAAPQALEAKAAGVVMVLNTDAGGGELDDAGRPLGYGLQAAEKTYADYTLQLTGPGGHSSRPTGDNVITRLSAAAAAIGGHKFPVELSDITRGMLAEQSRRRKDALGVHIKAFLANPTDAAAVAALTADPGTVGLIRTTCEPTIMEAGHAPNALPQRASLIVNCRILPGTDPKTVQAKLAELAGDPAITVKPATEWPATPASPLSPDITTAVRKAIQARFPGLQPTPDMSAGATDSVFYRAQAIPSYGVSGLFMRSADAFAHGLNERIPLAAIAPAVAHWRTLITEIAQ